MAHEITFYLIALLTLAAAIAAMSLRNLVHCALCAAGAFAGLAAIYLLLNAEFVGFAQFLVYVGAVAILIVFTILLTQGVEMKSSVALVSPSWLTGLAITGLMLACIVAPILASPSLHRSAPPNIAAPVKKIGEELMTGCILPLETVGLLLTAALLGAVVIAMSDKPPFQPKTAGNPPRRETQEEVSLR